MRRYWRSGRCGESGCAARVGRGRPSYLHSGGPSTRGCGDPTALARIHVRMSARRDRFRDSSYRAGPGRRSRADGEEAYSGEQDEEVRSIAILEIQT